MTPAMTPSTAGGFGGMHASATGAPQKLTQRPAAGMAAAGEPTLASLPPVVAELCRLHSQLTARGVSWEAAFQPYDYARAGVVSMSDLLRIFRESGLSPPPSLLREVCSCALLRVRVTTSFWLAACSAPAHTHAQERGIAWLPRGCSASCGPCGTPRILRAPLRPMHAYIVACMREPCASSLCDCHTGFNRLVPSHRYHVSHTHTAPPSFLPLPFSYFLFRLPPAIYSILLGGVLETCVARGSDECLECRAFVSFALLAL